MEKIKNKKNTSIFLTLAGHVQELRTHKSPAGYEISVQVSAHPMQTKIAKSHESSQEGRERIPAATGSLRKQRLDTEPVIIPAYSPRITRRRRTKATPSQPVSLYSWKSKITSLSLKVTMHVLTASLQLLTGHT